VKVDGKSVGAVSTYTFSKITTNHTIAAEFASNGSPNLSLDISSLDFGKVKVGASVTREITITNKGSEALIISGAEISGRNSTSFKTSFAGSITLMPSQFVKITVIFKPTALGDKRAVLTIVSNDPDESERTLTLRGIGSVKDKKSKHKKVTWIH